jgi:hypothetical protein
MYNKFLEHPNTNNILAKELFGFRKISTKQAIRVNKLNFRAINNTVMVCGTFYDVEKAFDCVNHKILLSQLEYYAITSKAQQWFESYFQNGYQVVKNYKS